MMLRSERIGFVSVSVQHKLFTSWYLLCSRVSYRLCPIGYANNVYLLEA